MVDANQEHTPKRTDGKDPWWFWYPKKRLSIFYNKRWGEKFGKLPVMGRYGEPESLPVQEEYKDWFQENENMTKTLDEIEQRWAQVEEYIYGQTNYRRTNN